MTDITMRIQVDKARLEELMRPGEIENRTALIVKSAAFAIEGAAKQGAPVLTGFLKNSIQASEVDRVNWKIEDGTEYGIYQELGTRFMAGKFFLTRACEAVADKFFDALTTALR